MNRRRFLFGLGALSLGAVAEHSVGRVFSFPSIAIPSYKPTFTATIEQYADYLSWSDLSLDPYIVYYSRKTADELIHNSAFFKMSSKEPLPERIGKQIKFYTYALQ